MKTIKRSAVLVAVLALVLVQVAIAGVAGAVRPRNTPKIGRQLAELKSPDTVFGVDFGQSVAISGTTAIVEGTGPAYVFTKTRAGWEQTAELKGPLFADFSSVAISGTTVVVGAPSYLNNAGRAFVFTKTAGVWKQTAELKGSDTVADNGFGGSVAISGTTAVVGSAGRAYVFTETAGVWKQVAELKGSDTVAVNGNGFGGPVAISGTTAVVGPYVFTETAGVWKQAAELQGSDTVANDFFGYSVGISGTTVVVGAVGHDAGAGRAYVFTKTAGVWKQAAELKDSDTVAGPDALLWFGNSVAISGHTAVVGVEYQAGGGRAYVFTETAGVWKQAAELKGSDAVSNSLGGPELGASVAISGTTAVVGAPLYGAYVGEAYVFEA